MKKCSSAVHYSIAVFAFRMPTSVSYYSVVVFVANGKIIGSRPFHNDRNRIYNYFELKGVHD